MRTDHFDLYQFHAVTAMEELETIVGPGGDPQAFVEAREQGLVRHLGFSAHTEEATLALMDYYNFDSILFPVNYVTWHQGHFGPSVLARAQAKQMGILALKTLAKTPWTEGVVLPRRHLRRGGNGDTLDPVTTGDRLRQPRSCGVPMVDDRGGKGVASSHGR